MRRAPAFALVLVFLLSMFGGTAVARGRPRALRSTTGAESPAGPTDRRTRCQRRRAPGHRSWTRRCFPPVASARSSSSLSEESVAEVAAAGGGPAAQRQCARSASRPSKTRSSTRFNEKSSGRARDRDQARGSSRSTLRRSQSSRPTRTSITISPVIDYELALDETVPYIGAKAVQNTGVKGAGIRVGVIDSGIDYTHVAFGGAEDQGAYEAAYGESNDDSRTDAARLGRLPDDAKVAGGFDYIGEIWPDGRLEPDPDPIDCGGKTIGDDVDAPLCESGHGTHVADIIGGVTGVAPSVKLYAVKVCSAVATSCSGVGLLGMDWAVDPNGDGATNDHVDIVNMSLGSDYGEAFDDDLSLAVDNASRSACSPWRRPATAATSRTWRAPRPTPNALSVAQTAVPTATSCRSSKPSSRPRRSPATTRRSSSRGRSRSRS